MRPQPCSLEQSLRRQLKDRSLTEILNHPHRAQHRVNESRDRSARIGALVDRAKDQGVLGLDFEGTEVIFIQVALTDVMDSRSHRSEVYRRC